jgi:DNA-binding CsgD family transcriptional regulator
MDALVGREAAIARLRSTVDQARGRHLQVVVVEGEAGIGKTALTRHVLDASSAVVVRASGDEGESDLDHGVIHQLIRDSPLGAEARAELLALVGGDPLRTGEALVGLVDGLAIDPDRPLVVVVDDAQWADVASLLALTFAARRLGRDPAVLCLVVRTGEDHRLPESLRRLIDDAGTRLRLAPLDRDAVRTMAEARTGTPVGWAAADRLLEHTGGNPLHLRTLLDELPPGAVTAPGDLPAPRSFATLVLSRLAGCPPEVEALVAAVAVLGSRTTLAVAAQVADLAEPLAALDAAVAAGLLAVVGGTGAAGTGVEIATVHPLVRAAVLGDLARSRRAELHRRAGGALEGVAGLRHRLLGSASPDTGLWQEAVAAAATEAARGAHSTAAGLLALAAGVATSAGEREQAVLDGIDELLLAGRSTEAAARRQEVDEAAPSARRSYVQGRLAYIVGPRRAARGHLRDAWQALSGAGDERSPLAARVAAMLAMVSVDRGAGADAVAWSRLALDLAPEQSALLSTTHMFAGGHALTGDMEAGLAELDERCAALLRDADQASAPVVTDCLCARGVLRLWTHDLEGAGDDLEASLAAAKREGSVAARESARFYLGEVRYRQGRWDEALLHAELAASIVEDADQVWLAGLPHATASRPLAARGSAAADHHLARAREATARSGSGVGGFLAAMAALEVAMSQRRLERAARIGDELVAAGAGLVEERFAPWRAGYVEALVAIGRLEDAAPVVAELAGSVPTPLVRNDVALATAVLAGARGELPAFDAAIEDGLALDPAVVGPYPRARLELVAGRGWRRRGERRRALSVLEPALARFRALGAEPWVQEVEREIVASGVRPASRPPGVGQALTPRELAVAQLVAQGMTNNEVAAELIVSAKTVEHHLGRAFTKLGVRSRTQLAALVLAGGP